MSVHIKVELTTSICSDISESMTLNDIKRRIQLKLFEIEKELENIEANTKSKFIVDLKLTGEIKTPSMIRSGGGTYG